MEKLLQQLQREFRAFREQTEDRIKILERSLRLASPDPVVVADEPQQDGADAAALPGADAGAPGAADTAMGGAGAQAAGDPASPPAPAADATTDAAKQKKGKSADQVADQ